MAGTVSAIFGDNILDILELDINKLTILYREAERQRWLEGLMMRRAYHDKKFDKGFQKALKVHGEYTEGFHKNELTRLKQALGTHG